MIIASPWSRGGFVNSEVFDHTSTLQFLETFLSKKTSKSIHEPNISDWRRTVCGNLTSAFRASGDGKLPKLDLLKKQPLVETVYNAKYKRLPTGYKALTLEEIDQFRKDPYSSAYMPKQETGIKPSCALTYQLYVDGKLNASKKSFDIRFDSSDEIFGKAACGSPFNVYAPGKYLQMENGQSVFKDLRTWAFAVKPTDPLSSSWLLKDFENNMYHLCVYGPNGFFREFKGSTADPTVDIKCEYQRSPANKRGLTGNIEIMMSNPGETPYEVVINDNVYGTGSIKKALHPVSGDLRNLIVPVDCSRQFGWYDFTVKIAGDDSFEKRYAGKVETGKAGYSDPYMGRIV
jgi:phospholipase C